MQKAGLVELLNDDRATLLGAFLELADRLHGGDHPGGGKNRSARPLASAWPTRLRQR